MNGFDSPALRRLRLKLAQQPVRLCCLATAVVVTLLFTCQVIRVKIPPRGEDMKHHFTVLSSPHDCDSRSRERDSVGSVFWTVLAGRRDRLEIQEKYWYELHAQGLITEVHLWDFTRHGYDLSEEEKRKNKEWIHQREEAHEFIKVKTVDGSSCRGAQSCFMLVYAYYGDHTQPNDVVVKADDDIVYVNASEFRCFIRYVAEGDNFLVSANVVNNAAIAHIQQELGMIPAHVGTFEYDLPSFGDPMLSSLYMSAQKAQDLHKYFIGHQSQFYSDRLVQIQHRFSVNFIAYPHRSAREVAALTQWALSVYSSVWRPWWNVVCPDEAVLTTYASTVLKKKETVYMRLVVAHAARKGQYKNDKRKVKEIVQMYKNLDAGGSH